MSKPKRKYDQENAMLFARLEELAGKVDGRIAVAKTAEHKITGLKFELDKVTAERDELKKKLSILKKQNNTIANEFGVLEAESFSIRNKIAKIVSDIEGQEVSEEGVKELIETLISEIDECVRLLK